MDPIHLIYFQPVGPQIQTAINSEKISHPQSILQHEEITSLINPNYYYYYFIQQKNKAILQKLLRFPHTYQDVIENMLMIKKPATIHTLYKNNQSISLS